MNASSSDEISERRLLMDSGRFFIITVGRLVKQCMHSFHSLDCLLSVFFDDYMSKLFPIFYLPNFVCFYPSKYRAFPPNINDIFLILPYTK